MIYNLSNTQGIKTVSTGWVGCYAPLTICAPTTNVKATAASLGTDQLTSVTDTLLSSMKRSRDEDHHSPSEEGSPKLIQLFRDVASGSVSPFL